jgi:hypothetical protein
MSSLSEDLLKTDRSTTMIAKGEWIVHGYDKLHINVLLDHYPGKLDFHALLQAKAARDHEARLDEENPEG